MKYRFAIDYTEGTKAHKKVFTFSALEWKNEWLQELQVCGE